MTEEVRLRIIENVKPFKRDKLYSCGIYEGVIHPLLLQAQGRKDRFIRVCAQCGRWWTGTGWQVVNMPVGNQTHGMCKLCYDQEMEAIKKWQRK